MTTLLLLAIRWYLRKKFAAGSFTWLTSYWLVRRLVIAK